MLDHWTLDDMPDLSGRVALVTGANGGLGFEVAQALARRGARVLLACRNRERARVAADRIGFLAEVVELDLASLASIRRLADHVDADEARLDLLVNNAGLMALDRSRTEDGFEMQLGVNHLGHFALTALLLPRLLAAPGSRVVTVASMGHRAGRMRFDDVMFDRRYDRWRPYFQSKLANILFTSELQRRLDAAGAGTIAVAAHPGASDTDLGTEGTGLTNVAMRRLAPLLVQPVAAGALPILRACTDPDAVGGEYYGPRWMTRGRPVEERASRRARNAEDARRLWDLSETLTRIHPPVPAA